MPDCASNKLTNCSSDWRGKQVNFAAEAASSLGKPETRVLLMEDIRDIILENSISFLMTERRHVLDVPKKDGF